MKSIITKANKDRANVWKAILEGRRREKLAYQDIHQCYQNVIK